MASNPPFQRLLTFFARQSSDKSKSEDTITFLDSLRGNLSLGLNLPLALVLALTRHLVFRNTGFLSLTIHIPSVNSRRSLLGGPGAFDVDHATRYTRRQLVNLTRRGPQGGWTAQADAVGLWMLAARNEDGTVSGEEVRLFQKGEIMERIAERRRGTNDILPFWRGGPLW